MMEHLFGTNAGKNGGKNGETKPGVQIQRSESLYTYSFTDDLLRRILHGLPEEYWTTYQGSDGEPSFLIWTTACKILGCSDLWDEYNRQHNCKKYNYNKNVGVWNGCNINIDCVTNLLVHSKFQNADKLIDYHKYQPVIPNRIIPDTTFTREKLGYGFFDENCERDNFDEWKDSKMELFKAKRVMSRTRHRATMDPVVRQQESSVPLVVAWSPCATLVLLH
jgi:hypothetical protein